MTSGRQPNDREPYKDLEPVVAALLANGATLTRSGSEGNPFWSNQGGYITVFRERIDWDHVVATVDLPEGIRYVPELDVIYDDVNWTMVYGSSARMGRTPKKKWRWFRGR